MPASALALVLVAALLHALWNVAAKKAGGNHHFVMMVALIIVVVWGPVGLWFGWQEVPRWGVFEWGLVLASGVTHLLYFNVLLKGYRESDLTIVYPVARGTGPLLTAFAAVIVLDESLSVLGLAGVLAVTAGVFLIAGGPRLWQMAHDIEQGQRVRAGLMWGALTGVFIATYSVIDGYAVKIALISPILVDYFGNLVRIPFMLPSTLRDRAGFVRAWQAQWRFAVFVAVVSPLAYVLVLYAVTIAPLSHVAPAREVSMLFAALIGGRLLGEADSAARLMGAGLIALGVAALALGGA